MTFSSVESGCLASRGSTTCSFSALTLVSSGTSALISVADREKKGCKQKQHSKSMAYMTRQTVASCSYHMPKRDAIHVSTCDCVCTGALCRLCVPTTPKPKTAPKPKTSAGSNGTQGTRVQ